ncbi:MAG: N-acetylmannosamine-6-phosphate 2-epimerase, partial [Eubacterium sp.]
MDNKEVLAQIKGGLIVSCQALKTEPLYDSYIMAKMAWAAYLGGAVGIRANTIIDIKAIKEMVDLPIIGIIKAEYDDSDVYITPTIDEVDALVDAGCEIIA